MKLERAFLGTVICLFAAALERKLILFAIGNTRTMDVRIFLNEVNIIAHNVFPTPPCRYMRIYNILLPIFNASEQRVTSELSPMCQINF